jgi:hypothetical protein
MAVAAVASTLSSSGDSSSWQRLQDDAGRAYYHDTTTGATQWEAPPGFSQAL